MVRYLLAAALLISTVVSVQAEPWRTDSLTLESGTVHSASVISTDGDYALVVECTLNAPFSMWVESPFDWEPGASYAPEVPTRFVVNGVEVSDVMFQFDPKQLGEGISSSPESQEALGRLLDAMLGMGNHGEIEFNYFDRSASFTTDGLVDSLLVLANNCL